MNNNINSPVLFAIISNILFVAFIILLILYFQKDKFSNLFKLGRNYSNNSLKILLILASFLLIISITFFAYFAMEKVNNLVNGFN